MSNKERITVTLDPDVLSRIDNIASLREESRSAAIERILRNGADEEEEFLRLVGGGGPKGQIVNSILASPRLNRLLTSLVGEHLSEERAAEMQNKQPVLRKAGERFRAAEKSGDPGNEHGGGES